MRFAFGKNWKEYLSTYFDRNMLHEATISTTKLLPVDKFKGKTFLDIGCGSGIFSLMAHELGARKVVSLDIDQDSVDCCNLLKTKYKKRNWEVLKGSILDEKFINTLELADIVYSWGVLHHTGHMWNAINNATKLVKPNGYLYIAIYNKLEGSFGSNFWLKIKQVYNKNGIITKKGIIYTFIILFFVKNILTFSNPIKKIRHYKSKRGMSWYYDVVDGLGGYPYEFASVEEIFDFCVSRGFQLINIKTTNGIENNEFVFRRTK